MKKSVNSRIIFGFCCAIGLVLTVGILSHLTFRQQTRQALLVKHTYRVINQLELIQKLLFEMETGRRGFRSTNDKRFLQPYTEARMQMNAATETLAALTFDNPAQQDRVRRLNTDIYTLDTLWLNINSEELYKTDSQRLSITLRERTYMDIIRKDIGDIMLEEQSLLAQREKENTGAVSLASFALIIGTLLTLVVVVIMIVVIISELRTRKKAQLALEDNFRQLDEVNKTTKEQNWLLTGVGRINNSIQDIRDLNALAGSCLEAITTYLQLPAAALYLYEEDAQQLQLRAFVGLSGAKYLSGVHLQEGLAGQAASKKNVSLITDIPGDFWKLQSTSGAALPDSILYVPLWLEQKLIGLVELCSFKALAERNTKLMEESSNNITMAINAASANEKIYKLLSQVQEQKEELETQQEELRQSNEELIRQSEILQASEEELRVQGEELRQVNLEMERKNDAIEVSRQALAIKAQELEQSSRYKSEFLANMSHELRTPLNSVLILAKLLGDNKTGNLNDKQTEYAHIIHKSGTDLLNLINDILDLSKIEAGKIDMVFEDVPFTAIAEDLKQLFRVVADEKKIQFSVTVAEDLPPAIHTDKQRLEQIIKNLLSNAFKFTPKDGNVQVSFFRKSAQHCGISVRDSGVGIPADKQQIIFEAFRQADGTTNRKYGGTGLGLSISRELTRKLGGELRLVSAPDAGSTFSIYLPLHFTGIPAEETVKPVLIATPAKELQYQSAEHISLQEEVADDRDLIQKGDPVILIIEDDKHFAAIVRDFARSKQYKTVVALQGDEGLYYVHHYRPAAIILDLHLPVVDGKTILYTLKNVPELSGIPVHVISSEDTTKTELVHARQFIRKPVAEADLEALFLDINGMIRLHFKKILVVSDEQLLNGQILNALGDERHPGIGYDHITGYNNFRKQPDLESYDCVILDIHADIKGGIACLQTVRELMGGQVPVIAFLETDISSNEELQLNKYANTIIRNTRMAADRLLDEMELFLYKIGETVQQEPMSRTVINGSDKSLKGKKVLLADDDMRNVFALSSMLESEEMEIITAADGREALELLRQYPDTDIVLMDIMMPEMDGYEAMEQIRADKSFRSDLPVIALTAKAMEQDREKCIRHGASDYITKPVDNEKLLSLMRVWLAE